MQRRQELREADDGTDFSREGPGRRVSERAGAEALANLVAATAVPVDESATPRAVVAAVVPEADNVPAIFIAEAATIEAPGGPAVAVTASSTTGRGVRV